MSLSKQLEALLRTAAAHERQKNQEKMDAKEPFHPTKLPDLEITNKVYRLRAASIPDFVGICKTNGNGVSHHGFSTTAEGVTYYIIQGVGFDEQKLNQDWFILESYWRIKSMEKCSTVTHYMSLMHDILTKV